MVLILSRKTCRILTLDFKCHGNGSQKETKTAQILEFANIDTVVGRFFAGQLLVPGKRPHSKRQADPIACQTQLAVVAQQ